MKIWHISDTHGYHKLLKVPENVDIIIFSGDATNSKEYLRNEREFLDFWMWFEKLPIKYKIFVPGNHDSFLEHSISKEFKLSIKKNEYILINESIEIEGIKIWGSPFTPAFYNWSFMRSRDKLYKLWNTIPDNTDIVVIHGPPKTILDLSYSRGGALEYCGCNALKKRILEIEPKLMLFGHIHNTKDIINAGTLKLSLYKTIFSNGSVVTDNKFGSLSSNGNILEI